MKSSSSDPPPTTADDGPMIFYFVITILMSRNVIWDLTANIIGFRIDGKMDKKALVVAAVPLFLSMHTSNTNWLAWASHKIIICKAENEEGITKKYK